MNTTPAAEVPATNGKPSKLPFTRKDSFKVLNWLTMNQDALRGKLYAEVVTRIKTELQLNINNGILRNIINDAELDLQLKRCKNTALSPAGKTYREIMKNRYLIETLYKRLGEPVPTKEDIDKALGL